MQRTLSLPILSAAMLACGCKVSQPSAFERHTLNFAKHHITVRNKKQQNPIAFTPQSLADGKEAFGHYCVACHGLDGQNTGVPFADKMSPPIPSLASRQTQNYSDGQLNWI